MLALALLVDSAIANPVINEILADPGTAAGDANCDGTIDTIQDEFLEIVNTGTTDLDLSSYTVNDLTGVRHTISAGTVLAPNQALVVFGGGTPTFDGTSPNAARWCLDLPGVIFQTSSTSTLGLNNTGDTVSLVSPSGSVSDSYAYGAEAGNDNSIVLSPELTGTSMVQHVTVATETWSPGTDIAAVEYGGGGGVPSVTLTGADPGTVGVNNTWTITNGLPSTTYSFYYSFAPGVVAVPGCPGLNAGLSGAGARFAGTRTTNANGRATLTTLVPSGAAGLTVYVQAIALAQCDLTNRVQDTF
jgi:hypothetical protein